MQFLERYGEYIGKSPWTFITIIIAITLVMGYFLADFEQESDEGAFAPEDDMSAANLRVQEEYGGVGEQVTVLVEARGNVLSRENLVAQLTLEDHIRNSIVNDIILRTPDNPDGITSSAEIVIQSIFYVKAMESASAVPNGTDFGGYPLANSSGNTTNNSFADCFTAEKMIGAFISKVYNLTFEEKRAIIEGGTVNFTLPCIPEPISLKFEPYTFSDLPKYTKAAPMSVALEFLLSKEYETGDASASKSLVSIAIADDIDEKTQLEAELELDRISEEMESETKGLSFIALGDRIIEKKINDALGSSMAILGSLALLMVIVVLLFIYRNTLEIIMSVIGLFMAVIWTFGLGGMLGFSFSPNITTVPVLIFGLGIDYGIHMTLRYREELRKGEGARKALAITHGTVGFAVLLATVTTLIGFLSNAVADSVAVRQFGILLAAGIFSAFVIMLTFPTAVKMLVDRRRERLGKPLMGQKRKKRVSKDHDKKCIWGWAWKRARALGLTEGKMAGSRGIRPINRALSSGASLAKHPVAVIGVVLAITGVGLYGGLQLEPRFDFRDFLPDDLEVADAAKSVVDDFDFSKEEAYVLAEGDVTEPDVFLAIHLVQERARTRKSIVSSEPFHSPLELGRTLADPTSSQYNESFSLMWHRNVDRNFDSIPDEDILKTNVTSVYNGLFNYAEEQALRVLKRTGEDSYAGLVIRIPVNSKGGLKIGQITREVIYSSGPMSALEGDKVERVTATGGPLVQQAILDSINTNQVQSVLITFTISLIILTLIFFIARRTLFLGLITLLPLVFVIAWTVGAMYYLGIPLNVVTVTISAITVGLGIDYGVHITSRFLDDMERLGDGLCALSVAVNHTGSALFGSAMTTVVGFAILSLSPIPPLSQFGQVTAISITFAFLASVFVLPTLLLLWLRGNRWYRKRIKGEVLPEMVDECYPEE